MIIVMGIPSEPPVAMVLAELARLGADVFVVNQRDFDVLHIDLAVDERGVTGELAAQGRRLDLGSARGAYVRLMNEQLLPELRGEAPLAWRRSHARVVTELLVRWCENASATVVNRISAMASNGSKPYQLQLVRAQGFAVPATLVTNDPDAVTAFRERHGRIVFKSLSGNRSIVRCLSDGDLPRLEHIRWCPVQFQEYVDGVDVRVHVVAEEVFATRIDSASVDYRYAHEGGDRAVLAATDIEPALANRCVAVTRALGLAFSGIDLRLARDGTAYCFEVNPSPGFSYYEANTGQPIARAVARLLAGS